VGASRDACATGAFPLLVISHIVAAVVSYGETVKRRAKSFLWLLIVGAVAFLIIKFIAVPRVVYGESMSPTLKTWDFCLMRRVRHYEPKRGDIVVFRTADDPPLYFVKRVIALPGETISIEHGIFKINGAPLVEPYTTINPGWQLDPTPVAAGKVFVCGDNRDFDREDYLQGLVATRLVQERLIWYWRWKR
jgi:signal peptidase I